MNRFRMGFALSLLSAMACNGKGCGSEAGYPTRDASLPIHLDASSVEVSVTFNRCPVIDKFQVSPTNVRVGKPIQVIGLASDINRQQDVTIHWSASSGTFADPTASQTLYTCTEAGALTLTLTVSDGVCDTKETASLFCSAVSAVPDGGVPDGGGMGTGGSMGGGGMGGITGDGGMGGGSGGGAVVVNTCPAEEPGSGTPPDCTSCTTANCSLGAGPAATDGCCGLSAPSDQLLCEAAYNCFAAHAETCTMSGDPTLCFCGTHGSTCFSVAGTADGPCTAQVIAAAKTSDPVQIQARFVSPNFPLGRAVNLAACRGAFCTTECAIP